MKINKPNREPLSENDRQALDTLRLRIERGREALGVMLGIGDRDDREGRLGLSHERAWHGQADESQEQHAAVMQTIIESHIFFAP